MNRWFHSPMLSFVQISQVYSVVEDRTVTDRELYELAQRGVFRLLKGRSTLYAVGYLVLHCYTTTLHQHGLPAARHHFQYRFSTDACIILEDEYKKVTSNAIMNGDESQTRLIFSA